MKIKINQKAIELKEGSNVFEALEAAKINHETVLVKRQSKLVPHDAKLKDGDSLELITVISGG
ncbi:MAG: MoaD/ThiS family protein [Candidatus Aenigmarchaeota archaeon]|nr:MoaD/ThiS family protein [Candidatus Aenigmarchaeota archaeon]